MLTVVVPTVPGRGSLLSRCLHSITSQGDVLVLVVDGDGRLGDKVTAAAQVVSTAYMTVVDDDDYLAEGYLSAVLPELGEVDYVGFRFLELNEGRFDNISTSSAEFNLWGRRRRGPVPKGVTRTEIFRAAGFGNKYHADRQWMAATGLLIHSWAFVDRVLYIHDWWPSLSTFGDVAEPRDVGEWPHGQVDRLTVNT